MSAQTLRTTNDQQSNSMINAGSEQDHRAHTREDLHHEPKTSSTTKCSTIHKWFDWHLAITPNDGIDSQRFSYWKLPGVMISKLDLQCGSFRSCWPLVKDRPFSFGVSGLGMEGSKHGPEQSADPSHIPCRHLRNPSDTRHSKWLHYKYLQVHTVIFIHILFPQKYVKLNWTIVPFISDDHFFWHNIP
jgi:hypothetical protein